MGDMAEDRVYDDRAGADVVYVAAATGVARVAVAHGRVGRFSLAHRCDAIDVAAARGRDAPVAVAAEEEVFVRLAGDGDGDGHGGDDWTPTEFGPAEAVGFDRAASADGEAADVTGTAGKDAAAEVTGTAGRDALLASDPAEHAIGRLLDPGEQAAEWLAVADVDAPVRAIDGPFLAAADGCYRATADGLDDVGLDDVRDVAATGPAGGEAAIAATGDGLYRLADGWERVRDGAFEAVAVGPPRGSDRPTDRTAFAVGADGGILREGGDWRPVDLPEMPADVAVGERAYGVTADGTVMAREADGWRTRSLGLPDVRAACVARTADSA